MPGQAKGQRLYFYEKPESGRSLSIDMAVASE